MENRPWKTCPRGQQHHPQPLQHPSMVLLRLHTHTSLYEVGILYHTQSLPLTHPLIGLGGSLS